VGGGGRWELVRGSAGGGVRAEDISGRVSAMEMALAQRGGGQRQRWVVELGGERERPGLVDG
jgi:hypothetical protein